MSDGVLINPEDLGIPLDDNSEYENASSEPESTNGIDLNEHLAQEKRKWLQMAIDRTSTKKEAAEWLRLNSQQALDSKLRTLKTNYKDMKSHPKEN